jgi:hypothetical protein
LKAGAILSVPYVDDDNDGYVDVPSHAAVLTGGMRIKVENLALYRFDENTQLWIKIPGSHIDAANKLVVAVTYNLGMIAVMGSASDDVSNVIAFPVPFVAKKHDKISFRNLPDSGSIKIYTVSGELVKEISFGPGRPDPLPWDVKNSDGQNLGADVYLYHVTSGENKKTGKIVIVR